MSHIRKELQQVIEEKLIENILLELDKDNTDSSDTGQMIKNQSADFQIYRLIFGYIRPICCFLMLILWRVLHKYQKFFS